MVARLLPLSRVCVGWRWPLAAVPVAMPAMPEFIHVVFSKGRPDSVERTRTLVGDDVFRKMHWFVGHGQRSAYLEVGAHAVKETGDLCHTVQRAIDMTNAKKKPLTFMSDDVRGFFCKHGDPNAWPTWRGRQLAIGSFAHRILLAMRQVGTPLGGVYQLAAARTQLLMPVASYHHFCNLDFLVMDPPFPLHLHHDARVNMKVDYHLTASVLAAFGATCRMNQMSIDAPHYRPGGAGSMKEREKGDAVAAKWLQTHWAPPKSKQLCGSNASTNVFVQNNNRAGNCQVIMNGKPLLKQCDSQLVDLHAKLHAAALSTRMTKGEVKKLSKRRQNAFRKLAIGSGRGKKWRMYKRSERGTALQGPTRRAGRITFGKSKSTMKDRQAISRARQNLRNVVLELRRKHCLQA